VTAILARPTATRSTESPKKTVSEASPSVGSVKQRVYVDVTPRYTYYAPASSYSCYYNYSYPYTYSYSLGWGTSFYPRYSYFGGYRRGFRGRYYSRSRYRSGFSFGWGGSWCW